MERARVVELVGKLLQGDLRDVTRVFVIGHDWQVDVPQRRVQVLEQRPVEVTNDDLVRDFFLVELDFLRLEAEDDLFFVVRWDRLEALNVFGTAGEEDASARGVVAEPANDVSVLFRGDHLGPHFGFALEQRHDTSLEPIDSRVWRRRVPHDSLLAATAADLCDSVRSLRPRTQLKPRTRCFCET